MSLTPFLRGVVLRLYCVLGEEVGPGDVRPKWPAVDWTSAAANQCACRRARGVLSSCHRSSSCSRGARTGVRRDWQRLSRHP